MKKLKFCLLFFSLISISIQSEAQLKQFQKWYVGGSWGYSYVPLDGYNDFLGKQALNSYSFEVKPFELISSIQMFSGEIIFRDSKDLGLRTFIDYYSKSISTTARNNEKIRLTRTITSIDLGFQVLWFLTQDYSGNQLLLGFGGALMLPLIQEEDPFLQNQDYRNRKYDNISGGAHFSLIGMIPLYQKWLFKFEGCYRFSRSSTFFEVNQNSQLNADIELTGFIGKVGFLYEF